MLSDPEILVGELPYHNTSKHDDGTQYSPQTSRFPSKVLLLFPELTSQPTYKNRLKHLTAHKSIYNTFDITPINTQHTDGTLINVKYI